jgi:hypothetical protein
VAEAALHRCGPRPRQAARQAAFLDFIVEIVRRSDPKGVFRILPRRWMMERAFGWMICWRRLVQDYERRLTCPKP